MRRRALKSPVSTQSSTKPQAVSYPLLAERHRTTSVLSPPPTYNAALSRRRFTLTGAHDGDDLPSDQPLFSRSPLSRSFLCEDQFQCAICLEIFVNPASTPCGHSFCMACIGRYWDGAKVCQCPLCKETFKERPDLQINRTLREITEQFKSMSVVSRLASVNRRGSLVVEGVAGGGEGRVEDAERQENSDLPLERSIDNKTRVNVMETEIQELILQREKKMEEIRTSLAQLQLAVERETAGSLRVYSELVREVEKSQAELLEVMEMSRRAAEHQADVAIRQLIQEVAELRKRSHTLSQLGQSHDNGYSMKSYPKLSWPPPVRDWSGVLVNTDLGTGSIYRSLSALVHHFQEELTRMAEFVRCSSSSGGHTHSAAKGEEGSGIRSGCDSRLKHRPPQAHPIRRQEEGQMWGTAPVAS
ncbi:hypothetical protein UPYG_G00246030 [Umbra pygmaea]|uniref:RING-type domain-containing protein n=1 Tax=Umbra pygmaea TaxID=75934 RepID=A0ABD0WYJ0_UMBPY